MSRRRIFCFSRIHLLHIWFLFNSSAFLLSEHRLFPYQIGDVYLLDFIGTSGFVQQLSPKVDRVIILDHHKTALKMIDDSDFDYSNVTKVIDMGRSGATIAYDFFMEKILSLENVNNSSGRELGILKFECSRQLFEYIEDVD